MKCDKRKLFTKSDNKLFFSDSNKRYFRFLYYSFKSFFKFNFKESIRYLSKANSIIKNRNKNNYPEDLIKEGKKVAVYVTLFGDADDIKPIAIKNPRCDYFIFTDQFVPPSSGWTVRDFDFPEEIKHNNRLKSRFLKTHPHLLFPEYDYSIFLDAVLMIRLDIFRLFSRLGNNMFGLYKHHANVKSAYEEAERIKRLQICPPENVDRQMNKYKSEGFPERFCFFETTLFIRKHSDPRCVDVMEKWWNEIFSETIRDQLSFTYALWKNSLSSKDVSSLGITYWIDPILDSEGHKKIVR